MRPRNDKLRIGQDTHRGVSARECLACEPLDKVDVLADLFLVSQQRSGRVLNCGEPLDPAGGPITNGPGIARFARLHEIFGEFPILFDIRAGRKRKRLLRVRVHVEVSTIAW